MTFPNFFAAVPTIVMRDRLAGFLGAADGGLIEYEYAEAVKLDGHSCPTVAGSYLLGCRELRLRCLARSASLGRTAGRASAPRCNSATSRPTRASERCCKGRRSGPARPVRHALAGSGAANPCRTLRRSAPGQAGVRTRPQNLAATDHLAPGRRRRLVIPRLCIRAGDRQAPSSPGWLSERTMGVLSVPTRFTLSSRRTRCR
ncbi:MAG: hypothetical protein AW12_01368 [Candidatus Accumulibacter sp. BA-94]|nr:MAG: hypothetical protein AW12_01368 [Candidatus Accumulibacter sp. BA-94]